MRRFGPFLAVGCLFLCAPLLSIASSVVLNLESRTNLAPVILDVRCERVDEREGVVGGKSRALIDYAVIVNEVVKNDEGVAIEAGKEFRFTTFTPARLLPGQTYLIFLKRYTPEVFGFVGGDQGVFTEDAAMLKDAADNKGLMRGVDKALTGAKAKGLSLKAMTDEDKEVLKQVRGPVDKPSMIDLIKRIDQIKKGSGR